MQEGFKVLLEADPQMQKGVESMPQARALYQNARKIVAQAHAAPNATQVNMYGTGSPNAVMAAQSISNNGGSQAHNNQQPFLVLTYGIALQGIFPSQN